MLVNHCVLAYQLVGQKWQVCVKKMFSTITKKSRSGEHFEFKIGCARIFSSFRYVASMSLARIDIPMALFIKIALIYLPRIRSASQKQLQGCFMPFSGSQLWQPVTTCFKKPVELLPITNYYVIYMVKSVKFQLRCRIVHSACAQNACCWHSCVEPHTKTKSMNNFISH